MSVIYPLNMPTTKAPSGVRMSAVNHVAEVSSPFTGSSQIQEWPAEYWGLQLNLPKMARDNAAEWVAFLAALRGKAGSFLAGPTGSAATSRSTTPPLYLTTHGVSGAQSKGLSARCFTLNTPNVLRRGDYIQVCKNYIVMPTSIDHAAWVKSLCTVGAANAIAAPDGSMTAERVTPTAGANNAIVYQEYIPGYDVEGRKFEFSVWLKAASGSPTINICIYNQNFAAERTDVSTPVTLSTSWQRFTCIGTMAAGDTVVRATIGSGLTWPLADGAIDIWGASLSSPELDARLHMVLNDPGSLVSGVVGIDIFPRLREDTTDLSPIIYTNPKGIFRLTENVRGWEIDSAQHYGITLNAREVI